MKEFQYTVKDACGIHARPAGLLVKTVKGFASSATLEKDGKSCDMRKLMALMGMGVKQGETITIKDLAALRKYTIWNAHYGVSSSPIDCDMWQGTEKARINGYSGELDANISYMG